MVNRAILIGNLGADIELRHTSSGVAVCELRVATSSRSKDAGERTEWHSVQVWERQAETCAQYLSKGSRVYVDGMIQTREYTAQDGTQRRKTEIKAHRVQFLDRRDESPAAAAAPRSTPPAAERSTAPRGTVPASKYLSDDEIPF